MSIKQIKFGHALTRVAVMLLLIIAGQTKASADGEETVYSIAKNITGSDYGTMSVTLENSETEITGAAAGATVYVTLTPNNGYEVESFSVIDADNNEVKTNIASIMSPIFTFTMPAKNVTIKAVFSEQKYYIRGFYQGESEDNYVIMVTPDKERAKADEEVTLTVSLGNRIVLDELKAINYGSSYSATPEEVTLTKVNDATYTFNMPAGMVEVSATFHRDGGTYTLTGNGDEHGSISFKINGVPVNKADEGEVVSIIYQAAESYNLTSITVTCQDNTTITPTYTSDVFNHYYSFTMPAQNVTVNGVFKHPINIWSNGYGTITTTVGGVEVTGADKDDEVTVTVVPLEGLELATLSVNGSNVSFTQTPGTDTYTYTFTMPDTEVLIQDTYKAKDNISISANAHDGNYWTTFCSNTTYKIDDAEDAYAYTATVDNTTTMTLHLLGKVIPNGTAVIIVGKDNNISMTKSDESAEHNVENILRGDETTLITSKFEDQTIYMMSKQGDTFGFFKYKGEKIPRRKAFLALPTSATARSLTMMFEDGTQGITILSTEQESQKAWYDLNGRRLNTQPTKRGVYVNNGKKVVIK